jgi:hypothetical protein
LICAAGPYHHSGWVASAIEPGLETPDFLIISYGRSPLTGRSITGSCRRNLTRCMLSAPHLRRMT